MVVVYPDDVAFLVVLQYGVGEALVDGDVLFVRGGFVEEFGFGGVGDCVVETWPEDLVTKFVITILELAVGNPDWQARSLGPHPLVNILPQTLTEPIRSGTQCPNPHLLAQPVPQTVNRIFQTTVPVGIRLEMPCLRSSREVVRARANAWCPLDA